MDVIGYISFFIAPIFLILGVAAIFISQLGTKVRLERMEAILREIQANQLSGK